MVLSLTASAVTGGTTQLGTETTTLNTAGNSYAGTTVISTGTLLPGGAKPIPNGSAVTLSGGTLNPGGLSDTAGVFSLAGSGTRNVDFGAGTSTLLARTDATTWLASGGKLEVWNWTGTLGIGGGTDHFDFPALAGGGTTFTLRQVQLYSGSNGTGPNGTGPLGSGAGFVGNELVPLVVIPRTYFAVAVIGLIGLIGWRKRRRFTRCPEARKVALAAT